MPSRWEVTLAGPAGVAIPLAAPLAVASGWLDDPQPDLVGHQTPLARTSQHKDQARPWAFGPMRTVVSAPGGESAEIVVQVRLLGEGLDSRLRAATELGRAVRLGSHQYQIIAPARQVETVSWQDLRRWSGERAWQLRFLTPACVRRNKRTSPLLAPDSVARGLAERWHRLHPQTAPPLPGHGAGPVWVSDIEGRSEVQILTRRVKKGGQWREEGEVISGFVGRIRYVCDQGSEAEAADFNALMAFAAFAGIGSHTTHGFGTAIAEPTWQAPTTRARRR